MNRFDSSSSWRSASALRVGAVALAVVGTANCPSTAHGAEPACEGVRVHSAADLPPEWADAVRRLVAQLAPTPETGCAAVILSVEATPSGGARLAAMAADGHYTERMVRRPSALAATALGLVAPIPPDSSAGQSDAGDRAEEGRAQSVARSGEGLGAEPPRPPIEPSPKPVELWLGLAIGARAAEPSAFPLLDLEARADCVVTRWLLSLSLRYAPSVGPDLDDVSYEEVVLGIGVGRRMIIGNEALDLSLVPALATMNVQWNQDDPNPRSGGSSTLRLGVSVRWSGPIAGAWRLTITSDADVAPFGLAHPTDLGAGAPVLPTWTVGLRIGASGELL